MDLRLVKTESLDGVGTKILPRLAKKGINSAYDILNLFPNRYINYELSDAHNSLDDSFITISGVVIQNALTTNTKSHILSTSFSMDANGLVMKVIIFNRGYLIDRLVFGTHLFAYGKYDKKRHLFTASEIFFEHNEKNLEPIYPDLGIPNYIVKKIIQMAFKKYGNLLEEDMPQELISKYRLVSNYDAYKLIHNPLDMNSVKEAKRRFKYEEILKFELELKLYQRKNHMLKKKPKNYDLDQVKNYISKIPFELTSDQKKATNDIFLDFKKDYPANRLIQGDVGSGKTVVASIAIYASITSSMQCALMAPTEILALQHFDSLKSLLPGNCHIALLTSNITGKKRDLILNDLKTGKIDLLIGTHSLIQNDVIFKDLGLAIIDEQHRFGVNQRASLRKKGNNPDMLYLTATPIPRTLSISVFGDLDISSIKTMPKGRKEIITKYVEPKNTEKVFSFINKELGNNHQAYIIAPLVEESEKMDLENVMSLYEKVKEYFQDYKVGLVHGKMNPIDKEEAMKAFKEGSTQILVSTTVIEVGVDVKNATSITIFDAHRFGLSQLHQLRGRVGRNSVQSYCFLISDYVNVKRLKIMESTNDGFLLSEEDLRLRGPGDFLGSKQSGIPSFKFIDLVNDINIITTARDDAQEIIDQKKLMTSSYQKLAMYLKSKKSINDGVLD